MKKVWELPLGTAMLRVGRGGEGAFAPGRAWRRDAACRVSGGGI